MLPGAFFSYLLGGNNHASLHTSHNAVSGAMYISAECARKDCSLFSASVALVRAIDAPGDITKVIEWLRHANISTTRL